MNKKLVFLFMISMFSMNAMGQKTKAKSDEPDNKNISKYLDDGRIGNVYNLVRLRLAPSLSGYYGASYERKLGRRFGLEGGLYVKPGGKGLIEFTRSETSASIGDYESENKVLSGFGMSLYPKIYYINNKYINNGYYLGLKTSYHMYSVESYYLDANTNKTKNVVKANFMGAGLFAGAHTHIGANITLGTEWGFMVYVDTYKNVKGQEYDYVNSKAIVVTKDTNAGGANIMGDISLGFLF